MTACWSKGSHARHPYYLCPKRGCSCYGKSIRREKIEGEFEALLKDVQPTPALFKVATAMFRELWDHRLAQSQTQAKALGAQIIKIEKQVSQLLERNLDATVPSVIDVYEDRIRKLEEEKILAREQIAAAGRPVSSFDDTLRTALNFLSSPWNLWASERLEDRRTVLKLTVADRLRYTRNNGFRTADLSMPFKVLGSFCGGEREMARPKRFKPLSPQIRSLLISCIWDCLLYLDGSSA